MGLMCRQEDEAFRCTSIWGYVSIGSAIPFNFSAVRVGNGNYGRGGMLKKNRVLNRR